MKNLLIMMILLLGSVSYSQTDTELRDAMLGKWTHMSSQTANDSVTYYWREKTFNADSTVYSIGVIGGDTLSSTALWYVRNGAVLIHSIYMIDGKEVIQLVEYATITSLTEHEFYIHQEWGDEKRRKTSHYLRVLR
jgi:hypothetical protein